MTVIVISVDIVIVRALDVNTRSSCCCYSDDVARAEMGSRKDAQNFLE